MHRLITLISTAAIAVTATQGLAHMTDDNIHQSYRGHAALAQFYRWYQLYERPEGGIANALDILTPDVSVTSTLGTANGHDEYKQRVAQLPDTWKNAHHVQSTEITNGENGEMTITAHVIYQNEGIFPDGSVRQADLTYSVSLASGQSLLPLFSNVLIEQNGEAQTGQFEDAYAQNRVRSLVHYWLALIEDPARDPEPVKEILAYNFSLGFSSGEITDFDGFASWLAGPGSQVSASTHQISNLVINETEPDTYAISMDFDWTGILHDQTVMVAQTRHDWVLVNDPTERFARIQAIKVEVLEDIRAQSN